MTKRQTSRERRELSLLKPHPKQALLFSDLSEQELKGLADDIAKNGLQLPPEILSDGTTVSGHQRIRAVRLLGWDYIDVTVRRDLEEAGEAAIERRLIEANLHRRHLDRLAIAALYTQLKELEAQQPGAVSHGEAGDLRDVLGQILGCSGRTLDRWLCVSQMSRPIQEAVTAKRLALTLATKLATLDESTQEEIAAAIAAGKDPKVVVRQYLTAPPKANVRDSLIPTTRPILSAEQALSRLRRQIGINNLRKKMLDDAERTLNAALKHIEQLRGQALGRGWHRRREPDSVSGCDF